MILDKLVNAGLYEQVHPRFKQAFDFLKKNDLKALPAGKIELDGKDLYVNVLDFKGKSETEARMETHKDYIDIQVLVDGVEIMGWKPTVDLKEETQAYDAVKDVAFYADKAVNLLRVEGECMAIFFPEDGHQPGIAPGASYRKVIVKVRV